MTTPWQDWPSVQRDTGSPIDFTFLDNWRNRYKTNQNRNAVVLGFDESLVPTESWQDMASADSEIYIPPWAGSLTIGISAALTVTTPPVYPSAVWTGFFRAEIGSEYSAEARVSLGCMWQDIGGGITVCYSGVGDGSPLTENGNFFSKSTVFTVPEAYRDTVQTFQFQGKATPASEIDLIELRTVWTSASDQYSKSWYWGEL